jgi:hypothetical protein
MKKGQGSAEMLMILGAVMIVALVVIALTLSSSGSTQDTSDTKNILWWGSSAEPFAVHAMQQAGVCPTGSVWNGYNIDMQNKGSDVITLTGITVAYPGWIIGSGLNAAFCRSNQITFQNSVRFEPGESAVVGAFTTNSGTCIPGKHIEMWMNLTYVTSDGMTKTERGKMPFSFNCCLPSGC